MNKRLYLNLIGQLCTFVLTLGINFFLTPFIVSNLGQETYGFVGLANNFINYITLFTIALNGMLSRYITVEYARKNYREASGYLSTAIITQIVLAVALLIPMMLLASYVDKVVDISPEIVPDVRILWILIFLSFLINFSVSGLNVSTYARNRLDISAIISIVTNLLRGGILLVTFLFFTPHVWYMGLASIICNTLYILMQIPLKRKLMPEVKIKRKYFDKKYIFKLLVVGVWNSLNKLQQILITGLDLLLTNVFISSIEMGLLSIAKTIPGIISTLIGTVSSTFEPQMTIVYGTGDMDKFVGETKFAMKFGGLLCSVPIIGFLCFGRAFYSLWMPSLSGTDVYKVHILAILTLLPEIFSVYIFPLYSVNTVTCKLKIPVLLSVAIGLLNILIVFILLKITNWGVLSGEKSAYMQMADCYRNYLISKYGLEKTDSDKQLYLNLTMAATLKKFYFGIPAEKVTALTTCNQTQNILEDIGDIKTAVRLDGIQKGGIEIGKFAGNFKLEQLVAKQNELDTLLKYAKEKNVAVYPNFDIVRFRKGVSGYKMAAYSASTSKSLQYFYNIAKGAEDPSSYIYYLINPLLHITAAQRVIAAVQENGFEGVSFGTLSNICYGDYRQRSTYVARGFANRVNSILKDAGKNLSVMGEAANDYAAVMCDDIISSPTSTSRYNGESRGIPFYQLVFKGYVPLSGEAVNLSNLPARELLYNASLGIGSLYSVTDDDTTAFNLSFFSQLSGGSYWQQNNEIKSAVADNTDAFKAAQNESIEDYVFLADNITKTTFSNGKSIIANFNSEDYIYGDKVVKSGGYIVTKGG